MTDSSQPKPVPQKNDSFSQYLEEAKRVVNEWPTWKKQALDGVKHQSHDAANKRNEKTRDKS